MFWRNRNKLLIIISIVLLLASSAPSRPRKMQRLPTGAWRGPHIRMDVDPRSATIEYDCANGRIEGPFTIDRKGGFSWRGTFNREQGGPIRIDQKPDSRPAIYSGLIKGDTMTLTVKLADSKQVLATYILKRGSEGRVHKCR
jgi:hypothetical protein